MNQKRRAPVTQAQVFDAANQLKANGITVSMNTVREIVGGSFNTLGPMIKLWQAEQDKSIQAIELPAHVVETMKKVTLALWQSASQKAKEDIESMKEASAQETALLQTEIKEYEGEVKRLEASAQSAEEKLLALEVAAKDADIAICELKASNSYLQSKLEDKNVLIVELKSQLKNMGAKVDSFQAELIAIAKQSSSKP